MHIEFQYGYYFFLTHLSLRQAVARKLCFESEAAVDVANRFARNTIADMTAYVELIQRCRRRRRQKGTLSLVVCLTQPRYKVRIMLIASMCVCIRVVHMINHTFH